MFFDRFKELCEKKGISVYKACTDIGLNRSAVNKWKNGGQPNGSTLARFARYFCVPVDCLLDRYNDMTTSVGGVHVFSWVHGSAEERLSAFVEGSYRIVKQEPGLLVIVENGAKVTDEEIANVIALHNGSVPKTEKAPAVSGERSVSDDDIKFALFGGDGEITDAMYDEVRRFAAFIKQREADKNKE